MKQPNYRVRITIYDEDEGPETPIVRTDEPLYFDETEIAKQAHRTQHLALKRATLAPLAEPDWNNQ